MPEIIRLAPDVERLLAEGFTQAQINRLTALREAYPHVEWTEENQQHARLVFLKWRLAQGAFAEEGT